MLTPANNPPGKPKKISDSHDPNRYILSVTKKGIKSALLGSGGYNKDLEIDIAISDLISDIKGEMLKLRNSDTSHTESLNIIKNFREHILPLLKLLEEVCKETGKENKIQKSEKIFYEVVGEICDFLGISKTFEKQERIEKLVSLIDKYGDKEKRA